MPTGAALHFPAGSYYEQMATDYGQAELTAMQTAWHMWYLKDQIGIDKYTPDDLKFISWTEENKSGYLPHLVERIWNDDT